MDPKYKNYVIFQNIIVSPTPSYHYVTITYQTKTLNHLKSFPKTRFGYSNFTQNKQSKTFFLRETQLHLFTINLISQHIDLTHYFVLLPIFFN